MLRLTFYYMGLALLIGITLWSNLSARLGIVFDPFKIRADALQHNFLYWSYYSDRCFQNDYIANYYLSSIAPSGLKNLFIFLSNFFTPIQTGTYLSILLALIFIFLLTESSRLLAGKMAGALTAFYSTAYLCKHFILADAISRSFAYIVIALGVYAIIRKKNLLIAFAACLGALFYPAAGAILTTYLGIVTFLPNFFCGGTHKYSLARRILFFGGFGILLILLLTPMIIGGREYGQRLDIKNQAEFPEVGLGGRYAPQDLGINRQSLPVTVFKSVNKVFLSNKDFFVSDKLESVGSKKKKKKINTNQQIAFWGILLMAFLWVTFCYFKRESRFNLAWQGLGYLSVSIILLYYLASLLFPYLYMPSRYPLITIPVLALIIIPSLLANFVKSFKSRKLGLGIFTAVFGTLIYISGIFVHHLPKKMSYQGNQDLYQFLEKQPSTSLIAGWPIGVIDSVPYYSCKAAFLTMETHQVFHRKYLLEMRTRASALIDAFFDNSLESIKRLNTEFGVSHLIVEKHLLSKRANYFAPFGEYVRSKPYFQNQEWFNIFKNKEIISAIVFRKGPYLIIDLTKIR